MLHTSIKKTLLITLLLFPLASFSQILHHWILYVDWEKQCPVTVTVKTPQVFSLAKGTTKRDVNYAVYLLNINQGETIRYSIKAQGSLPYNLNQCKQQKVRFPIFYDKVLNKGYFISISYDPDKKTCICQPIYLPSTDFFT